ncbi:hypothetical protein [Dyella caseinilytica]|uniref:Uncharacterized protein n=1 Tax=Dyella caseinilytica TaxID=1849581 RepID=A0ABX7GZT1_9GAMM|nr:hypothetical protein [Dyella caseinilytica]QRN55329.1 hypothetical protein ISN74_08395 [Dyella caseinilytica]GGA00971.1 hypothetical protein GCM10011408_22600 [Dyella caseinilytica]
MTVPYKEECEVVIGADKAVRAASTNFSDDLRQHGSQSRHADRNAGGEEAIEHQGFEFHGGSPFDE